MGVWLHRQLKAGDVLATVSTIKVKCSFYFRISGPTDTYASRLGDFSELRTAAVPFLWSTGRGYTASVDYQMQAKTD